ncbi:MAG: site-2 protease family protein [Merismopedia sp. SIO2A8]|nr:site-2 protease family protein [Merismopedia sp. SIO2A8]
MNGIRVGSLFGIPFFINPSWFLVFALVTWSEGLSLSEAFRLSGPLPWVLGMITALLMFSSVVLHELGHSLVAMRQGIEVKSITLFIFGGLASLAEESKTPGNAFWVAIAGPLVSFALFVLCTLARYSLTLPAPVSGILGLLGSVNLILGAFNLIPGLPLDGGNILKALVWKITGKPYKGVAFASRFGQFFGWFGVVLGINAIFGNILGQIFAQVSYALSPYATANTLLGTVLGSLLFIPLILTAIFQFGSVWTLFIGLFLLQNANRSAQTAVIQEELSGLTAADAIYTDSPVVLSSLSLREFANAYLIGRSKTWKQYLVVDNQHGLVGTLDPEAIKAIPTNQWWDVTVETLTKTDSQLDTVTASEPLLDMMAQYAQRPMPPLVVQDDTKVVGVIEQASVLEMMQRRRQEDTAEQTTESIEVT